MVDFRTQKEDPNRVRMIAWGGPHLDSIQLTTGTADLTTAKIFWNSVLSMEGAKYAVFDVQICTHTFTSTPQTTSTCIFY